MKNPRFDPECETEQPDKPLLPIIRGNKTLSTSEIQTEQKRVRSMYALTVQVHNSCYTELHQQARLGFRRPRGGIRLRPLSREIGDYEKRLCPWLPGSKRTTPIPPTHYVASDVLPPLAGTKGSSTALFEKQTGIDSLLTSPKPGVPLVALSEEVPPNEAVFVDDKPKPPPNPATNQKAKRSLLAGLKDGTLEKIATDMENGALEKKEEVSLPPAVDPQLDVRKGVSTHPYHGGGNFSTVDI